MTSALHFLTILGSGSSTGIPVIGCTCSVCQSADLKDQRLRTSILISSASGKQFLVDMSPDLRTQLLREKITQIDHIILTHSHADHLHGIDEIRAINFLRKEKSLVITTDTTTAQEVQKRFDYIFGARPSKIIGGGRPQLEMNPISPPKTIELEGESFTFYSNPHGEGQSLGLVHGKFAYMIDCHIISKPTLVQLRQQKLDLLLIDCVQAGPHDTHLNFDLAMEYIEFIGPKRAGLIHMGHKLGHKQLEAMIKERSQSEIFVCYDGLKLSYCG